MSTPQAYSFSDAVLYFFKVLGRRPGATLWVGLWNGLLYLTIGALIVITLWPFYEQMIALALSDQDPEAADIFAMMAAMSGFMVAAFFGGILMALMAQGAWLRLLARDEVAPLIPLRFGSDELRLLGVNALFLLLAGAAYVVMAVGVVVVGLIIAGIGAAGSELGAGIAGGLVAFVFVLALIAATAFVAIRFAPAPALSVLDRKMRFFDAWPVTRGIFWWALLTYIVMGIMVFSAAAVLGSMAQLLYLPAVFPVLAEFVEYSQTHSGEPAPQEAFNLLWSGLTHPAAIVFIVLGTAATLMLQVFYEGAWHSVGAYLARRHRGLESEPETVQPSPVPAPQTGDAGNDSGSSAT